jgi:hypothetical protein
MSLSQKILSVDVANSSQLPLKFNLKEIC